MYNCYQTTVKCPLTVFHWYTQLKCTFNANIFIYFDQINTIAILLTSVTNDKAFPWFSSWLSISYALDRATPASSCPVTFISSLVTNTTATLIGALWTMNASAILTSSLLSLSNGSTMKTYREKIVIYFYKTRNKNCIWCYHFNI